ncbi:cytochrome P450 [Altererythrobacter sp. BO-6]|uniref:cytochrome P450 n=1 Tax=Altererythrobacter sp. BO-6 TaxID=2604537 RepID=UPI0013E16156|nr:cytochrome P450 [Altererythrobacter sp. BO-6]QIG53791.1 cytochrome P450 [Altererythrobacter sp. BO-6]
MEDLGQIDATSSENLENPYPYYDRLRKEAPVFRDPKTGIVSVSTYDLVLEVNKKPKLFSSNFAALLGSGGKGSLSDEEEAILAEGLPRCSTLLTADPPEHTRYKRVAMQALPYARIMGMAPYIAEVTHDLIDSFAADGEVEFKAQFAEMLPGIVIADVLGVPRDDIPVFQGWVRAAILRLNGNAKPSERASLARSEIDMQEYFRAIMADRRANPGDDVVSSLVTATIPDGEGERLLVDAEVFSIVQQIFTAGQEATAHALAYAIAQLLANPKQMQAIMEDHSLVPNWVGETARHLSPSHNMWRIVKEDTVLGGVALKAGEPMLLRYGSANRDCAKFAEADKFDVRRENAREHIAFGAGVHTCLGMHLARLEMVTALPIVLQRLQNLRFADPDNPFQFAASHILRGMQSLRLKFDPA